MQSEASEISFIERFCTTDTICGKLENVVKAPAIKPRVTGFTTWASIPQSSGATTRYDVFATPCFSEEMQSRENVCGMSNLIARLSMLDSQRLGSPCGNGHVNCR